MLGNYLDTCDGSKHLSDEEKKVLDIKLHKAMKKK
jgi:hypothetical protein